MQQNTADAANYRIGDIVIYTDMCNVEHEHTILDIRITAARKTVYKLSKSNIMFGAKDLKLKI